MLKRLVLLGIFLTLSPFSKASHIHPSNVVLYFRPDSSGVNTNSRPDDTKTEETYWRTVCKPDILPVWVGGAAALIASIVGARTLGKIKEQTEAAVVASNAAKKSADAQINIERPWLLIEELKAPQYTKVVSSDPTSLQGNFLYTIKNYGKTPARVCALMTRFELGESADLPPNPTEVFGIPDFLINPHIISQNGVRPHTETLSPALSSHQNRELNAAKMFLWAYGFVRYRDVHGGYYETRICYRYDTASEDLILAGPREYNNAT